MCNAFDLLVDLRLFLEGKYRKIRIYCDGLIKKVDIFFELVFACSLCVVA